MFQVVKMRFLFLCVIPAVLVIILRDSTANASILDYYGNFNYQDKYEKNEKDKLLMEAGCIKGHVLDNGTNVEYGSGNLLAKRACISRWYRKWMLPENNTKVYTTIKDQNVRSVDPIKGTVSIDYKLTLRWMDPAIKTNFSEQDKQNKGIVLDKSNVEWIWIPDLYIYNLSTFTSDLDTTQVQRLTILTTNELYHDNTMTNNITGNKTSVVELKLELKSTVYCNFNLSAYPMDKQMCTFRFGSASSGATFVLYDPTREFQCTNSIQYTEFGYSVLQNLDMNVVCFDAKLNSRNNTVGLNIAMHRHVKKFIMKYYLPCAIIVFVSQLSFIIPPTAIPGRVALLVTDFLTLTNLYIHQMASISSC